MALDPSQQALADRAKAAHEPLDLGACLGRAWDLLKADFWGVLGAMLALMVINGALTLVSMIPILGILVVVLLSPPLGLGAVSWFVARARGGRPGIGVLFSGFSRFGESLALYLVGALLILVGFLFCILPGIYLALAWAAAAPLLADRRGGFWECLEMSRQALTAHFGWLLLFCIMMGLVAASGVLLCGVGLLVTAPLAYLAYAVAYVRLFDGGETPPTLSL